MEHFELVCQHGYKHGSCRCPSKAKTIRTMVCNTPEHASNPMMKAAADVDKLQELYDAVNEFAKAAQLVMLDKDVNTHEEFLLLAHDAAVMATANARTASNALWDTHGSRRGC